MPGIRSGTFKYCGGYAVFNLTQNQREDKDPRQAANTLDQGYRGLGLVTLFGGYAAEAGYHPEAGTVGVGYGYGDPGGEPSPGTPAEAP
jgi:hypothetical protein